MTFNSLQYAAFLPIVLAIYWQLGRRGQNLLLLGASWLFYALFDARFLGLLILSTVLDFWCGRAIHATDDDRRRRSYLMASVGVNLAILGAFKYYGFFIDSAQAMLARVGLDTHLPVLQVLLPVGISFYTFHGISYVVDIYRRRIEPTNSPLDYAVFVAFFPQLVAGPIGRAEIQLPQFGRDRERPDASQVGGALMLILTGLFKKVVIADAAASVIGTTFNDPGHASAPMLVMAAFGFAIQIYGDFSGYSDIARGSARLLGIDLPLNFRQPYLSRSITEFWRRWHISLSNWLRDYLYVPLGGNRGSELSTMRNLMLTMLLGGLWHGAAWTFVVWGGLHGSFLAVERALGRGRPDVEAPLRWRQLPAIAVTSCLAVGAFVVFRAASLDHAMSFAEGLVTLRGGAVDLGALALVLAAGTLMVVIDLVERSKVELVEALRSRPEAWGLTAGAMATGLVIWSGGTPVPFIYFQF